MSCTTVTVYSTQCPIHNTYYIVYIVIIHFSWFIRNTIQTVIVNGQRAFFGHTFRLLFSIHFLAFSLATVFFLFFLFGYFLRWAVYFLNGTRDPFKWRFNWMNGLDRLVHWKTIFLLCRLSRGFSTRKEGSKIDMCECEVCSVMCEVWSVYKCGKGIVRNIWHYSEFRSFPKVPFKWIDRKLNIR